MSRVAAAAIEAALDGDKEKPSKGRLKGVKAVATGAALAVAAQAAAKRAPVHRLAGLASVPERLRERVQERGWLADDEPDSSNGHYEEPEDEEDEDFDPEDDEDEDFEPEDEEDEDSEPEAEEDEDFEPEDEEDEDSEPEAEEDEDFEPEDEPDEEPESSEPRENGAAADAPALALLSAERPRPRFMSRAKARVDPASRPPEPPESDSDDS